MESESSGEPLPSELIVFISDASAEAERLTLALRTHGYVVIDVPLALLASRVAVQRPALVLCDADAEGSLDTLERVRALTAEGPVPVILLGQRGGAMEHIDGVLAAAAFARPVNVKELADTVERLIGVPSEGPKSLPPSARKGFGASSQPAGAKTRTEGAAVVPLPPDLTGDPAPRESADAPALELSAEIQAALVDAERRLDAARPALAAAREEPDAEVNVDVALPADVLAALEEPLDEEEAEEEHGPETSGGGTSLGRAKTGSRGQTTFSGLTGLTGAEPTGFGPDRGTGARARAPSDRPPTSRPEKDAQRRAKQQASTPKPPRLASDDSRTGNADHPERRPSVAPTTAVDQGTHGAAKEALPPSVRLDVEYAGTLTTAQTSTTPPLRARPMLPETAAASPERVRETVPPPTVMGTSEPLGTPGPGQASQGDEELAVPPVLRDGDAFDLVARAIRLRFTGALRFEVDEGIRRIVFRDGDFVTAASAVHGESLVSFLASRGDLPPEMGKLAHKLPAFGRRAGAALIAQGHLPQDRLWPVLRAHAEWLIGRICRIERGQAAVEPTLIDRLRDEPAVFGGATGAEVFVEVVRRVVSEEEALTRLGGPSTELATGHARALLGECALPSVEAERIANGAGKTVRELTLGAPDPSFTSALVALLALGILGIQVPAPRAEQEPAEEPDPLDDDARRVRILARKALVDDGDYFAVLGVPHDATAYDIRRAYSVLKRDFEPAKAITPGTADLADTVDEILEVLDEAYDVLGDQRRRDRYRRAIEAVP